MLNQIIQNSGIAILVSLYSLWYAYRIIVARDVTGVRKGSIKPLKDKEGFIKEAGRLFIIFAIISAVAAVALMFSYLIGTIIVLAGIIYTSIRWKAINEKYE